MHRERGGPVMSIQPHSSQNVEIPLSQILQQTGICLAKLSEKILDLEYRIWGMQAPLGASTSEMSGLQSLDFVKQAVDDLAAMLDRLGDAVPPSIAVSEIGVIAPMKLEELRGIIGIASNQLDAAAPQEEVELF